MICAAYDHSQMKQACLRFSRATNSQPPELLRAGWSGLGIARITRLHSLAGCFVELQEARHRADYDLTASFTRPEAMAWIQRVRDAFADWTAVKNSHPDAASLFALTLLTWGQVSRRG